jgi:hypothetical protein
MLRIFPDVRVHLHAEAELKDGLRQGDHELGVTS